MRKRNSDRVSLGLIEYLDLSAAPDIETKQRRALQAARLADRIGYSRVWIPEHHGLLSPSTNALTMAAVIGSHTDRIRVGTAVILLRIRNLYLTAEDVSTAAAFCGSRLDVGIGRGDFGGPGSVALDNVRKSDTELTSATDQLFSVLTDGCEWIPPLRASVQRWLHGTGRGSAVLAGDRGTDYCHALFLNPDIDVCLEALRLYRSGPRGTGRTAIAVAIVVNDDPATATVDAQRHPFVVNCIGSARECAQMIHRLIDLTGVDDVVIGEMSSRQEDHLRGIEQVLEAVNSGVPERNGAVR